MALAIRSTVISTSASRPGRSRTCNWESSSGGVGNWARSRSSSVPTSAGRAALAIFMKMASAALPAEVGTEEERERAQLPTPPEEDSQLQVLLRPGLLADVEITVERIANAIHIPAQAIFEKEGKPAVWVE